LRHARADAAVVHVLFTDVNMPGALNGIDLAERLRVSAPTLHLIITSALPILRAVDHLAATFVSKPYDAGAVSRTARALLGAWAPRLTDGWPSNSSHTCSQAQTAGP
jgi:DNA-binding LytR/AlgR family response regulator